MILFVTILTQILALWFAGAKYELPKYVLSEPTNLIHEN